MTAGAKNEVIEKEDAAKERSHPTFLLFYRLKLNILCGFNTISGSTDARKNLSLGENNFQTLFSARIRRVRGYVSSFCHSEDLLEGQCLLSCRRSENISLVS